MKKIPPVLLSCVLALSTVLASEQSPPRSEARGGSVAASSAEGTLRARIDGRFDADFATVRERRPGFAFWQYIFTIPDGSIAYGSDVDGRLLAVFPAVGNWAVIADYRDKATKEALAGMTFPSRVADRRDAVAERLETEVGPVIHNATRGHFLLPNIRRFGPFLDEWGAIYERFGVPAALGLSQAIVESGLNGTARSEARAIGFCQWLLPNWRRLQRLSPRPIEGYNQTTQAQYCAAYLSVLATKYGSFIPALSDHHAGATNVGRALINGARLGGTSVRDQYFLGSDFARDVRVLAPRTYSDTYGTYGPRSYRYAEMVFGNTSTVERLRTSAPQTRVYAMRVPRAISLSQIVRRSGIPTSEVRRYNPALIKQVPAGANLYLPKYVKAFGPDVSYWHKTPSPVYLSVLNDFLALDLPFSAWDTPRIVPTLSEFQRRFARTGTEEGTVMSTVLRYVISDVQTSGRAAILAEFETSPHVQALVERAVKELEAQHDEQVGIADDGRSDDIDPAVDASSVSMRR